MPPPTSPLPSVVPPNGTQQLNSHPSPTSLARLQDYRVTMGTSTIYCHVCSQLIDNANAVVARQGPTLESTSSYRPFCARCMFSAMRRSTTGQLQAEGAEIDPEKQLDLLLTKLRINAFAQKNPECARRWALPAQLPFLRLAMSGVSFPLLIYESMAAMTSEMTDSCRVHTAHRLKCTCRTTIRHLGNVTSSFIAQSPFLSSHSAITALMQSGHSTFAICRQRRRCLPDSGETLYPIHPISASSLPASFSYGTSRPTSDPEVHTVAGTGQPLVRKRKRTAERGCVEHCLELATDYLASRRLPYDDFEHLMTPGLPAGQKWERSERAMKRRWHFARAAPSRFVEEVQGFGTVKKGVYAGALGYGAYVAGKWYLGV